MKLKTVTMAKLMRLYEERTLCKNPLGYAPADWSGTAIDVLRREDIPANDRLWVVLRTEFLDDRTLRLFAVWCARQALALMKKPDPRSVTACDVAERYANGQAADDELEAAWAAAKAAVGDAAWAAARAAAGDAAGAAAWAAEWAEVWVEVWAEAGAEDGAEAWAAAMEAQINHLIEMLESPGID